MRLVQRRHGTCVPACKEMPELCRITEPLENSMTLRQVFFVVSMDPVTIPLTCCTGSDGTSVIVHTMKITEGTRIHRTTPPTENGFLAVPIVIETCVVRFMVSGVVVIGALRRYRIAFWQRYIKRRLVCVLQSYKKPSQTIVAEEEPHANRALDQIVNCPSVPVG